jgi:hypothetical protein
MSIKGDSVMSEKHNVGVIGLGGRGLWALRDILCERSDVNVTFVCDEYPDRTEVASATVEKKQGHTPHSSTDWREVIASKDVDVIVNCTAWESHIPVSVAAMEAGKPVSMEVGGAYNIEDCFKLVNAFEKTGIHCMMVENCCYGREELLVLNMVRQGLFGKVVHCEGGYQHDLREEISFGEENRHYRLRNYKSRNTENYPTHELGPIAKVLNINRGNKLDYLVAMASGSWGLNEYAKKNENVNPALRTYPYKQGDIVKTLIKCAGGETIAITLDTTLPRNYSRGFTVRGTKGMFFEDGDGVYLDGLYSEWNKSYYNNKNVYFEKYDHPLWKSETTQSYSGGHGGMDWLVYEGFFEYVRTGKTPPIDTYDTATWMAITPLSTKSIENGSIPVEIPDFTDGKWKNRTDICEGIFSLDK